MDNTTSINEYDDEGRVEIQNYRRDYKYGDDFYSHSSDAYYAYSDEDRSLEQMLLNAGGFEYITNYSYDNLGRLTDITTYTEQDHNSNLTVWHSYTYATGEFIDDYDNTYYGAVSGQIAGVSTSVNGVTENYTYTYNDVGYITHIYRNGTLAYSYEYDDLGQLTREDNRAKGYSYVYTYDNAGNITSKKRYAFTTGTLGDVQQTYSYSYNDSTWSDLLTSYNGESITYDTIGNPLSIGYKEFTWEGRQLKTYFDGNYTTISYNYNADGILTYKEYYDSDSYETYTHYYTLSGSQIVKEDVSYIDWYGNEGEYTLVYIYDELGAPIGIKYRTQSYAENVYDCYFFEKNLQGDIVAIYNASGAKIVTYVYDAWGNVTTTPTSGITSGQSTVAYQNPFRYRGYYYDTHLGMYYLQSRYYNPEWGRFLNGDALSYLGAFDDLQGYNLFAYCLNNPIMGCDPTGYVCWWGVIAGAAVTVAGIAIAVASGGIASPIGASLILEGGTLIATTGIIATGCAIEEGAMVLDVSSSNSNGDKQGVSLVIDFENETFDLYGHHGKTVSTSPGESMSYSVGRVFNYDEVGDYGGAFVNGGGTFYRGFGADYCRSPDLDPESCYATSITYSPGGNSSGYVGMDYYYQIGSIGG